MIWNQLESISVVTFSVLMVVATVFLISVLAILGAIPMRRRPAMRHTLLLAALGGCLMSPFVPWIISRSERPIVELAWLSGTTSLEASAGQTEPLSLPPSRSVSVAPPRPRPAEVTAPVAVQIRETEAPMSSPIATPPEASDPVSWFAIAGWIWGIVSLVFLARLAGGYQRLRGIVDRSEPITDSDLVKIATSASAHAGLVQTPLLLRSGEVRSPAVIGTFGKMAVLIPDPLLSVASEDEMRSVMIHEFAHVRRRDPAIVLFQSLAKCLFWPILTIHWLDRELNRAREEVCDNYVLRQTDCLEYGKTLLKLGQLSLGSQPIPASVGMFHWKGQLESRVAGFLDAHRNHETRTSMPRTILVATLLLSLSVVVCGTRLVEATDEPNDKTASEQSPATIESKQFTTSVVDSQGKPVSGALVELWQLAYASGSRSPESNFAEPKKTDASGKVVLSFPAFVDDERKLPTNKLGIRVSHPEYPEWSQYLPIEHEAPIRLATPVYVTIAASFPDGSPIASDLHAFFSTLSQQPLGKMIGPTLRIGPIDLNGRRPADRMRVVHAPTNGAVFLSDIVDLSQLPREENEISVSLKLSPSSTVRGTLSAEVPRPIKNGKVYAFVLGPRLHDWRWSDEVSVGDDGSFELIGLPGNEHVQLVAVCDGWISLPPKPSEVEDYSRVHDYPIDRIDGRGTGMVTPQLHYAATGQSATVIRMHETGVAKIKVVDWDDNPIVGAVVSFSPNQKLHNGGSQVLGSGVSVIETLRLSALDKTEREERTNQMRAPDRRFGGVTDDNGELTVTNLPAHKSVHLRDGVEQESDAFIGFHVVKDGFKLVPEATQRIFSSGGRPQESITMTAGGVSEMRVRMEKIGGNHAPTADVAMVASPKANAAPPKKRSNQQKDAKDKEVETVPITVRGTCKDTKGNPVAGARVHLVSVNSVDRRLAETTSDANGRYLFQDVPMPIRRSDESSDGGTINVYATSDSFGLTWHGMRFVLLDPRPEFDPIDDQNTSFYKGESIFMNLEFLPKAKLHGTIADEQGKPVANASVELSGIDYLDTEGKIYHHNYREFWGLHFADKKYRVAKTDADGNFEIDGLPQNSVGWVRVSHPDFANQAMYVAITDRDIDEYTYASNSMTGIRDGKPYHSPIYKTKKVETCPLNVRVAANRSVTVVVADRDGGGVEGIRVSASSGGRATGVSAYGVTKKNGQVKLDLPVGEYRLSARPPRDSTFVTTYDTLRIGPDGLSKPHRLRLVSGCVLVLKAVDAETGEPIEGMSFWRNVEGKPGSRTGLNSSVMHVDHPVTDEKGTLRVVVKPGRITVGVGWSNVPKPYRGGGGGRQIECAEGDIKPVRFELRKSK